METCTMLSEGVFINELDSKMDQKAELQMTG